MDTLTDLLRFLLQLGAFVVVFGPLVVLVEMAHLRSEAEGRSVRSFPTDDRDADARRVAAELRALHAAAAPVPKLRGRRHVWVSRDR
ncbi:hypothetical protein H9L10_10230 [Phycicoccus endophyticus]|uniref:Uncharacterized protein n=1 Tax=Phycicoccus endophyticus TaxID=1690220 RepID=A0A7G9QZA6_9MICO|nr:hypothetical protein [Phycicoccus endophyticus]NHI19034.1 hypothetical protein [Phycicoccus endophyticus]QNN48681.1 hypothetical protein H9L10_10230 [Phycicoccus endophyticus]GGL32351.1 hypothetical protein GCM10012283_13320 [Phycicoccus endophyticus]